MGGVREWKLQITIRKVTERKRSRNPVHAYFFHPSCQSLSHKRSHMETKTCTEKTETSCRRTNRTQLSVLRLYGWRVDFNLFEEGDKLWFWMVSGVPSESAAVDPVERKPFQEFFRTFQDHFLLSSAPWIICPESGFRPESEDLPSWSETGTGLLWGNWTISFGPRTQMWVPVKPHSCAGCWSKDLQTDEAFVMQMMVLLLVQCRETVWFCVVCVSLCCFPKPHPEKSAPKTSSTGSAAPKLSTGSAAKTLSVGSISSQRRS